MFRTSAKAAVGAFAAGTVLTVLSGCGPVKMGTAATVGGERITTARLDGTVAEWKREFDRNPQADLRQQAAQQQNQPIPFDLDSPRRSALMELIDIKVWDEVARQQGVTVTQGQVDQLLASLGGQANIAADVLANDVPLRYTPDLVRSLFIQRQLLQRYGLPPDGQGQVDVATQQQAIQQIRAAYSAAATKLNISVNPRFGRFDPKQVGLTPVSYRLSKAEPITPPEPTSGTG